jgi:hypothetical protein
LRATIFHGEIYFGKKWFGLLQFGLFLQTHLVTLISVPYVDQSRGLSEKI